MLKLPLEALLEQMLADHGIAFSERRYGEEIEDAAMKEDTGQTKELSTNVMLSRIIDQYWFHLAETPDAAQKVFGKPVPLAVTGDGRLNYAEIHTYVAERGAAAVCADFLIYAEHHPDYKGKLHISTQEFMDWIVINQGASQLSTDVDIIPIFALLASKATEDQQMVAFDVVPFFMRTSGTLLGIQLRYSVLARDESDQYRLLADEIIGSGNVGTESIEFMDGEEPLGEIYYRDHLKIPDRVSDNLRCLEIRERFQASGLDFDRRYRALGSLNGKSATPEQLVEAIKQLLF